MKHRTTQLTAFFALLLLLPVAAFAQKGNIGKIFDDDFNLERYEMIIDTDTRDMDYQRIMPVDSPKFLELHEPIERYRKDTFLLSEDYSYATNAFFDALARGKPGMTFVYDDRGDYQHSVKDIQIPSDVTLKIISGRVDVSREVLNHGTIIIAPPLSLVFSLL